MRIPITERSDRPAIVAELRSGASKQSVAAKYDIPASTLKDWWRRWLADHPEDAPGGSSSSNGSTSEPSFSGNHNADGSWTWTWRDAPGIPSKEELDANLRRVGQDPAMWRHEIRRQEFKGSAREDGWRRDKADRGLPHTAYTEPSSGGSWHVVVISVPVKPSERAEVRQAKPVVVRMPKPPRPLTVIKRRSWQTWMVSPDEQIGYSRAERGGFLHELPNGERIRVHTTHDERWFALGHQIAAAVSADGGLHGWASPGDLADAAAFSRWDPATGDTDAEVVNLGLDRTHREMAARRQVVGPDGELLVAGSNHDERFEKFAASVQKHGGRLVGLRRPGDPDDEHPMMTLPYMIRAHELGVEWVYGYPSVYRMLNRNMAILHCAQYGSKPLATARAHASKLRCNVVFGHTHRAEETSELVLDADRRAVRVDAWTDGTWGRSDGALPAGTNGHSGSRKRLAPDDLDPAHRMLPTNAHAGCSIVHVEVDGDERVEVERVRFRQDGTAFWRGVEFRAGCDPDGVAVAA